MRHGIVQTYFGQTRWYDNNISIKSTYEYVHRQKAIGTGPFNIFTKPFCDRLNMMSTIIFHLLNENKYILNLGEIDTSSKINHFIILVYHSIPSIKPCSKNNYHIM